MTPPLARAVKEAARDLDAAAGARSKQPTVDMLHENLAARRIQPG
jgi:hypothetical protein